MTGRVSFAKARHPPEERRFRFDRGDQPDERRGDLLQVPSPSGAWSYAGTAGAPIIAFVFVILVLLGVALWLWQDRARILADGERVANNLVMVLQEQTGRTFQAVDLTLAGIVDALRLAPPLRDHDPAFEQALRHRRDMLPYVRALFVIGPDGFITQDTDRDTPRVSLADRNYFIAHAEDPGLELYVGPPLVSRSVGTWFVSVSRRIDNRDGSFGGIAVAAVEPRYFESFYEELALGQGDVIALFGYDGILIARYPGPETAIGQSFTHFDLFRWRLSENRRGTYHSSSSIDGVRRIFSYRALDSYPLVVTVGLAEDALLAEWRRTAVAALAVAALVALLVGTLAAVLVRQQRQRDQARERLAQAQKLEALGHMTGSIVHDFKNLLTAVSGGIAVIRHLGADGEVRKVTEMLSGAVTQGNRLINQLLAFARHQELAVQAIDANAVILGVESLLRHAAGPKVKLELDLAPALWPCLADLGQFDAAMMNLIVNAKDAMPAGGRIRISTTNRKAGTKSAADTLRPGDYVRVTVADNGSGMAPDVLQRALDPYFTTKKDAGTGLGLSQVYGFVRQIGGDMRIESHVGSGTAVHLFFPRATGDIALVGRPS